MTTMVTESNGSEHLADRVQSELTISSNESLSDSVEMTSVKPSTAPTSSMDAKLKKKLDKIVANFTCLALF